jgi:hypothetical protein
MGIAALALAALLALGGCGEEGIVDEVPSIEIASAADLMKIGGDPDFPLSGRYLLTADITVNNWTPVAYITGGEAFTGVFDGAGHTITITSGKGGVFGLISQAHIHNLTVAGTINAPIELDEWEDSYAVQVGGVAGNAVGSVIENCVSTADITALGDSHNCAAGGIAGYVLPGSVIRGCTASGNITLTAGGEDNMGAGLMAFGGGIVGMFGSNMAALSTGTCTLTTSHYQDGTVTVSSEQGYPYAGGLVGYNYYSTLVSRCSVTDATVTAKDGDLPYAGGLAAYNSGYVSATDVTAIKDCFARNVTVRAVSKSQAALAGGIAGANARGALISRCYASGTVAVTVDSTNRSGLGGSIGVPRAGSAGGIAGAVYYTHTLDPGAPNPRIENCMALTTALTGTNSGGSPSWNIFRIAGKGRDDGNDTGEFSANSAGSMTITPSRSVTPNRDANDGATAAEAPPAQGAYTALGWDFSGVWEMSSTGYPALR